MSYDENRNDHNKLKNEYTLSLNQPVFPAIHRLICRLLFMNIHPVKDKNPIMPGSTAHLTK